MKNLHLFSSAVAAASLCLFVSCADLFQEKIAMSVSGAKLANLSSLIVQDGGISQLDAPAQVFASQNEYSDKIIVTWSVVPGASSYRLERAIVTEKNADGSFSVPDESEFDVLNHSKYLYDTSFVDTILTDPTYKSKEYDYAFFYRVSAENPRLKYDASEFTVSGAGKLLAPTRYTAATMGESTTQIKIEWNKVDGASRYEIFRSLNEDGTGSVHVAFMTGNQTYYANPIDTSYQGVNFYYTVYAISSGGVKSVASPIALGYSLQEGAPARVSGVQIVSGRGTSKETDPKIEIKWNAVGGSNVSYNIYRTSSIDSAMILLKQGETTTGFTDTTKSGANKLEQNVYYYYQIQSIDTSEKNGEMVVYKGPISESGQKHAAPAEGFILSPPQTININKKKGDSSLCLFDFTPAIGAVGCPIEPKVRDYNDYKYKIYGSDTQNGTFSELTTLSSGSLGVLSEGLYRNINIASKKFYKVSTVNGSVESSLSPVLAPSPYAVKSAAATRAAFIPEATGSDDNANSNGVHDVKITWEAPEDGADGYAVYRSTKKNSGFKKISESVITELSFIDHSDVAKPHVIYYYRVLSLNSLGQGSNYSDSQAGWGALTAVQYMKEYNITVMNSQKKLTLMHKAGNTDKLGKETVYGKISGSLAYDAGISGLSGRVIMHYENYADYYIIEKASTAEEIAEQVSWGPYFICTGNTNTSAGMDTNGTMDGTVQCSGMYTGSVGYDNIKIKGGAAGGGTYKISRNGFAPVDVDWTVGEK